ncbi:hypothetical protein THICB1_20120 [Thiomonas arsenitoxydans]|uniref:Uncharacterized protein n=1 Tax=Thiomonas arsenitoxydans (strain DSM 22701 / CIP 110005 / 3As) TaxID=426114 RepID=A0ABP1Z2A8_THIA3|nr:hypothetical protein THICB1_20120 [Thiomonas arsenitoxydans]
MNQQEQPKDQGKTVEANFPWMEFENDDAENK